MRDRAGRGGRVLNAQSDSSDQTIRALVRLLRCPWQAVQPIVSPAKNSLAYFITKASMDHPVWRSQREEATRGPPAGLRIPRSEGARMALLLPYAPPGLSHIAGWCSSGAPLRGQPWTPAMMLPHRCKGLRVRRNDGVVDVPQALYGAPSTPPIGIGRSLTAPPDGAIWYTGPYQGGSVWSHV